MITFQARDISRDAAQIEIADRVREKLVGGVVAKDPDITVWTDRAHGIVASHSRRPYFCTKGKTAGDAVEALVEVMRILDEHELVPHAQHMRSATETPCWRNCESGLMDTLKES